MPFDGAFVKFGALKQDQIQKPRLVNLTQIDFLRGWRQRRRSFDVCEGAVEIDVALASEPRKPRSASSVAHQNETIGTFGTLSKSQDKSFVF
jgi:hypothetical protein